MTEDAGQGETLAQRIRKRIEEEKEQKANSQTTNQPPAAPISPGDQELIDRLSKRVVGIAHDMVERLGGNIDGLRQLVTNLQESGLQKNRKEVIDALLQIGLSPHSWRQNPQAYFVQSYFNNLLDQLTEEYGEAALHQHLIEELTTYADRYENSKNGQPNNSTMIYSNKKLALAFKSGIIVVDPGGMPEERKAEILRSFEEQIVEKPEKH